MVWVGWEFSVYTKMYWFYLRNADRIRYASNYGYIPEIVEGDKRILMVNGVLIV